MSAIKTIIQDDREILIIHKSGDDQTDAYRVGHQGITKIVPYEENGQYCMLPFLAVYKGDVILARLPASDLFIQYRLDI